MSSRLSPNVKCARACGVPCSLRSILACICPTSRIRTCSTRMLRSSAAMVTVSLRSSPSLFALPGGGELALSTGAGAQGGGSRSSDLCGIARRATARSAACAARSVWPGFIARRARPGLEFAKPHPVGETQPPARALRPEGREAAGGLNTPTDRAGRICAGSGCTAMTTGARPIR
jgi:hypothetical protein